MLSTPERLDALTRAAKAVLLKHKESGDVYAWTYKRASRNEAVVRAYKALKRDRPDVDVTEWTVTDE